MDLNHKSLSKYFVPAAVVLALLGFMGLMISQSLGPKQQREVVGVVADVSIQQGYGATTYTLSVDVEGQNILVPIDSLAQYQKGQKVILNKVVNQESGSVDYRYLRAAK